MASSVTPDEMSYAQAQALLESMASAAAVTPGQGGPAPLAVPSRFALDEEPPPAEGRSHLWRADRRYRALIEQIPVVTFLAGIDDTVHELYVSPQIQSLLGFSQTEWLENPFLWYEQLHPDDRERWQAEFARTCTTGVDFRSEYRFLARDGRVVWVHGECQLVRDEDGEPLFLQGIAYDISESKRAQEALERMHRDLELMVQQRTAELAAANESLRAEVAERQRAQQALSQQAAELTRSNDELSQFAYVASHDLQEPLRMMASFAQLLAERYERRLDDSADKYIHFITDGASRMQRLIHDLLQYSRVGKGDLAFEPTDCRLLVDAACANLRASIEEKGARVTTDALPVVRGNETQLLQLFQNLIGNALKFGRPSTPVQVHVGARREGGQWLFWVRDNGIGFDPSQAERVFLIFQRLHTPVQYPGTGIGLAICRKIVERHHGRIWAESTPGQGSTFFFALPAQEVGES